MHYRNFNNQTENDCEYNAVLGVDNLQQYIAQDEIKNAETLRGTKNILDLQYGLTIEL